MAINFPSSPATNDTFTGPTGLEYIFDGVKWRSFKPSEPVVGTFNANSAISLIAGGTNQNITLTPSGTGVVTTTASVGISNSAPSHKLSVNGTAYFGGAITIASNNAITVNGSVGTAGQVLTSNTTGVYWATTSLGTPRVLVDASNSATPTLNTDSYDMMVITGQTINITSMTTNLTGTPVSGQRLTIAFTSSAGNPSVTWGASFESSAAILPIIISTIRKDVGFVWNATTSKWRCVAVA